MRQKHYLVLGITAIVGIVLISGCVQRIGPGTACNWVFKTKGNYSNLVSVGLNSDKTQIINCPIFSEIKKLNKNYYTAVGSCTYSETMNIAFTSITLDEWKRSQEDCNRQMKEKDDQLKIKKCGSLDFDVFEECNTFTSPGNRTCKTTIPPKNVTNPTKCTYDITLEENKWRNSCEPTISTDDLLNNIIDDEPFTELYICRNVPFDELNSIINNDELNTRCKRQI